MTITDDVRAMMAAFAKETGLAGTASPSRRYLWTDAFAVCNFLTLHRRTGKQDCLRLALDLVDRVHGVLGRHRADDPRRGWISGLDEAAGADHPTAGGLRIGKTHAERRPDQPFDDRLEWDRDGQYFHYLTKWMHALERAAAVTGDVKYLRWAIELARAAHAGFRHVPAAGGAARLYWKMSIDLTRPLVLSMGLHDPLDALVTYTELRLAARNHPDGAALPGLKDEIEEAAALCRGTDFATNDPLGIGGMLCDALRVARMAAGDGFDEPGLAATLLRASAEGIAAYMRAGPLDEPADYRLAFRELGLSIGLKAVAEMQRVDDRGQRQVDDTLSEALQALMPRVRLAETIEDFWREASNQRSATWQAHRDINMVMLATSLAPDEFLML